jgi:SAM-dependent methyltransferase
MTADRADPETFYTELFTRNAVWSTPHPNIDESRRVAKIMPLLSEVAREHRGKGPGLQILDLGCGRGWLTYLADAYGECLGIDPVGPVIGFARERFPQLRFEQGAAADLIAAGQAGRYDVVIASEVIEHVPIAMRDRFVGEVRDLLTPSGAAIITTDRGELYERWARRAGTIEQPQENWVTERELRLLFERHGFAVAAQERAYLGMPDLSLFHRLVASGYVARLLSATRQRWLLEGLQYAAAACQVWMFRRKA